IPIERAAAKFGGFDHNIATKCRATHPLASTPYRHAYGASAGRIGSQRHGRVVLKLVLVHPLDGCKRFVDNAETAAHDGCTLSIEVPGEADARGEVAPI